MLGIYEVRARQGDASFAGHPKQFFMVPVGNDAARAALGLGIGPAVRRVGGCFQMLGNGTVTAKLGDDGSGRLLGCFGVHGRIITKIGIAVNRNFSGLRNRRKGRVNLVSINTAFQPMQDALIDWAAPVEWVKPGVALPVS